MPITAWNPLVFSAFGEMPQAPHPDPLPAGGEREVAPSLAHLFPNVAIECGSRNSGDWFCTKCARRFLKSIASSAFGRVGANAGRFSV